MSIRVQNLPPLSAFLALEAVVRHVSFTKAALELKVSQAAVSQQVKALEDYLGLQLIVRERPRIRPAPAASVIAAAVRSGIDGIETAVQSVRGRPDPARIAVAATTAFSSYWLMPRLTRFFAAYPELEVNLLTKDLDVRDTFSDFDVGIVFTDQKRPGYAADRVFGDEVMAVCSPAYLAAHPDLARAADLLTVPLLHLESDEPWMAWAEWFAALSLEARPVMPGPHYTSYILATQAALEGQGVVLGWRRLIQPLFDRGSLVQAVAETVVPQGGYDVIVPDRLKGDAGVDLFRRWLLGEAARDW